MLLNLSCLGKPIKYSDVRVSKSYGKAKLYIPKYWSITISNAPFQLFDYLTLTSSTYLINLPIPISLKNLTWCETTRSLLIVSPKGASSYKLYINTISRMTLLFTKPTFTKLKFKGKGYYIYKCNRNTVAPQFGFSHRIYLYNFRSYIKFIGKTCVIIFGLAKDEILPQAIALRKQRPINIFTGRGVRLARQVIYRKPGKVSTYK